MKLWEKMFHLNILKKYLLIDMLTALQTWVHMST